MSPLMRVPVILVVLLLVPGCQTVAPASRLNAGGTARSSDILAASEIQSERVDDALEAVLRFRPEFLKGRAGAGVADPAGVSPVVYLNGVRQGGADMLRTIPVAAILEIRYLTPTVGSEQFGRYHNGGVISVRTRR